MIRSPIFAIIAALIMFIAGGLCFYCAVRGGILIGLLGAAMDWLAGSLLLYRAMRRPSVG